jgi:CRP-like cAMP-binding protein
MSVNREVARQNRLLNQLSPQELEYLLPHLWPVELPVPLTLSEADAEIETVHFPVAGLVSLVSQMRDGAVIEIGAVGAEGALGSSVMLGRHRLPYRQFVQISGRGLRMEAEIFLKLVTERVEFRQLLLRYQSSFMVQSMQSGACNGLHNVEQRCCKWLLLTQDRLRQDRLDLTHEFLGQMLGVRRASVTEVLQPLRELGLLTYSRGSITIENRVGLEERACECYRLVAEEYRWLNPPADQAG